MPTMTKTKTACRVKMYGKVTPAGPMAGALTPCCGVEGRADVRNVWQAECTKCERTLPMPYGVAAYSPKTLAWVADNLVDCPCPDECAAYTWWNLFERVT